MDQSDRKALEALLDKTSLSAVLDALGDICGEKAEHLQANWQERTTSPHVRFWNVWRGRLHRDSYQAEGSEQELMAYRGPR